MVGRTRLSVVLCCALAGACGESARSDASDDDAGRGGASSGAGKGGTSGTSTAGAPMGGTGTAGSDTAGRGGGTGGSDRGGTAGEGASGEGGESAASATGGAGGASAAGAAGSAGQPAGGAAGTSGGGDSSGSSGSGGGTSTLLNMLIMFDRSASMLVCVDDTEPGASGCETAPSRWDVAATDLTAFVGDPAAAGLGVALRFFPHDLPVAGCSGGNIDTCDAAACAQPLVDLGRLTADPAPSDAQETALASAISASTPDPNTGATAGGTPTYPALAGALDWATAHQATNPTETTVVVFVTDGEPNGCTEDWDEISLLAVDALATAGVLTFAVGLTDPNGQGVSVDEMNQLAAAGGTDEAYFVSDGASASVDLLATLNAIRAGL